MTPRGQWSQLSERDSWLWGDVVRPSKSANTSQASASAFAAARGLVEANDGTLVLSDTPGGGLTVEITLPVAGAGATR